MSAADTKGKVKSSIYGLYHTRTDSPKTAGYLDLPSTEQLRNIYRCDAWKDFWATYSAENHNRAFKAPTSLQNIYSAINIHKDKKKYGHTKPTKAHGWDKNDFYAHSIMRVLALENLPGSPKFGPLEGEVELEAYNRTWQLIAHYSYLANSKRLERLTGETFTNKPAVKPKFMMAQTAVTPPTQPTYLPYQFKCKWVNKSNIEKDLSEAGLPANTFAILDPRVYDARQQRDYVRRALDCKHLKLDLRYLKVTYEDEEYDSREYWPEIQSKLRAATTNEGLARYKFSASLKSVSSEVDIFEVFIPAGLESRYSVNPDGQV
ncbi:hypothetical protein LTS15_011034 [Exophiala xenobiotica]|nr:hypothetical protein LTS15_011034 [Exophiala xenobiotica]